MTNLDRNILRKLGSTILRFGKYKKSRIDSVPDSYLLWCTTNAVLRGKALLYAKIKLQLPKSTYTVTVEDSIGSDGDYIVEAYSTDHAYRVCMSENRIQGTQSYHGTTYSAVKLFKNEKEN
jgi:uncharacterized protein (DUF3820 family)